MPRGKKTDNKMIAKIIASYALTNSYNATSKKLGVSANTVKNVINKQKKDNPEKYAKVCEQKKEAFAEQANEIVNKGLELLKRRYDKALKYEEQLEELIVLLMNADEKENDIKYQEKISIAKKIGKIQLNSLSEITTSMGTLYDKMRLAKGESTNNNSLMIQMSDDIKELSQ